MKFSAYPRELYPFQNKSLAINGNHIHYIDEGKGDIILFCPPPVSSSFMYRHMIKELRQHYRCIVLDFPGFGLSIASNSHTHSISSQAVILEAFIRELELNQVTLLMQEIGGHAAMSVFIKHPQLLKAVIITDTIIFPVSQYPQIKRMLNIVNGGLFNFINSNFNFLVRAMTKYGIRNRKLSEAERNIYKAIFGTKKIRLTATAMLHQLVSEESLLAATQKSFETIFNRLPALIIYGEKDPLTAMGIPRRVHSLLPNSELHLITGEGHFPHEGKPGKMATIIREWMK